MDLQMEPCLAVLNTADGTVLGIAAADDATADGATADSAAPGCILLYINPGRVDDTENGIV